MPHATSAATNSASAIQLHVLVCLCEQPAIVKHVLGPSIAAWAPLVDLSVRGQAATVASADTPTPISFIESPTPANLSMM